MLRCSGHYLLLHYHHCVGPWAGGGWRGEREVHNDGLKHNNNVRFMPAIFYNHLIHLVLCENESSLVTCNQDNDEKVGRGRERIHSLTFYCQHNSLIYSSQGGNLMKKVLQMLPNCSTKYLIPLIPRSICTNVTLDHSSGLM